MELGYIGRRIAHEYQPLNLNAVPYMMTLGGQTFANAYKNVVLQCCNGIARRLARPTLYGIGAARRNRKISFAKRDALRIALSIGIGLPFLKTRLCLCDRQKPAETVVIVVVAGLVPVTSDALGDLGLGND